MTNEPIPDPGYEIISITTADGENGEIVTQIVQAPITDSKVKEPSKKKVKK